MTSGFYFLDSFQGGQASPCLGKRERGKPLSFANDEASGMTEETI
jgi:hypothetical protein